MAIQHDSDARPTTSSDVADPAFHHIGIQTTDLRNSVRWYEAFLGCRQNWSLDRFSELTKSRLEGIKELTELSVGSLRLHIFERASLAGLEARDSVQFQHLCLKLGHPDDLVAKRQLWLDLYASGDYSFAVSDLPTEVVEDDDGVQSFYAFDVNGLELELTYVPGAIR